MYFLLVAFFCTIASVFGTAENNLNDVLFSGEYEFIDLTHPFDNHTLYWPDSKKFEFTNKIGYFREDGKWYSANNFAAGEHGGTHIDAPYHFAVNGKLVGDLPLDKLIVPLIIADVSSKTNDNPAFVLYKRHLDYILNDNLGRPCIIIFKFGWSKYFSDRKKYFGTEDSKSEAFNFPGLSKEVAEWITTSYKNVVGVGVDTASLDPGSSTDFPVHRTLAANGLYNMENVDLSRQVPEHGCTALVLPMKIREGTGAPLRLIAICPKQIPTTF